MGKGIRIQNGGLVRGRNPAMERFEVQDTHVPGGGYLIRMEKRDILIVGDDRTFSRNLWQIADLWDGAGTLHGVQALLRDTFDVRWIWPGDTGLVAPQHRTLAFREPIQRTYTPRYRGTFIKISTMDGMHSIERRCLGFLPTFGQDGAGEASGVVGSVTAKSNYWTRRGVYGGIDIETAAGVVCTATRWSAEQQRVPVQSSCV